MSVPFKSVEKWDVHTHTTVAPDTYEALARFSHYVDFIRVRAHAVRPCCAEMVDSRGVVQRVVAENAYDASARLVDCDSYGVTMQVLSPTPMMIPDQVDNGADALDICKILNDGNDRLAGEHPRRFTALGALPMGFADLAIKEMERIRSLGMRGIEINSNIHGIELDDDRFYPVFEAAEALGMAVFIHPWGGFMSPAEARLSGRMRADYRWRPWLIAMGMETALAFDALHHGRVHERLPRLRVLYAHGGGVFPTLLGRMAHGAYCRPDLFVGAARQTPYETIAQCGVYTDALTHDPWALAMLVEVFGARRIAMGSDYPYPLGEMDPFITGIDPQCNACPYPTAKGIYPGHMVEHLPSSFNDQSEQESAWRHFPWLNRGNADGPRFLPCLTDAQKQSILSETAKEWLQCK